MEPVTLIVGALAAGAAAGAQATAGEAIKDAYQGLKTLVKHKLADKPSAELVLAKHEEKPEIWQEPLRAELIEIGADRDQEIVEAAKKLMTLVSNSTRSQTNIKGNVGVINNASNLGTSIGTQNIYQLPEKKS